MYNIKKKKKKKIGKDFGNAFIMTTPEILIIKSVRKLNFLHFRPETSRVRGA